MKLLYQTHSPFARQVLVLAHETGLAARLEVVHHETSPTRRNEAVCAVNPLGKVPVLVCDDGVIADSAVISDYLDRLHGGPRLIPEAGPARLRTLGLQALAHGMAEAGIAIRWETGRRPPPLRWPAMAEGQAAKLAAAYDALERDAPFAGPLDLGQIALAAALSWLEFRRLPGMGPQHRRLGDWYRQFSARPSMQATTMIGETQD